MGPNPYLLGARYLTRDNNPEFIKRRCRRRRKRNPKVGFLFIKETPTSPNIFGNALLLNIIIADTKKEAEAEGKWSNKKKSTENQYD